MPTVLEGAAIRLSLNQSAGAATEKLSGENLVLEQGADAHIACCLFKGTPSADTLLADSNITSATFILRKHNPRGDLLLAKTTSTIDTSASWSDWDADLDDMFTFDLTEVETNLPVWDSGQFPIYWCVRCDSATSQYVAGFGYGLLKGFGLGNTPITPPPTDGALGVLTHSKVVVGEAGTTTIAMVFDPELAAPPSWIGRPVFIKAAPGDDNIDAVTIDSVTATGYNVNLSGNAVAGQVLQNVYIP